MYYICIVVIPDTLARKGNTHLSKSVQRVSLLTKHMANYVGLKKAALHFDVSRSLLYKLESQGEINFYQGFGNRVLVDMDELNAKISRREKRQKDIQTVNL